MTHVSLAPHLPATDHVQVAAEETSALKLRETEMTLSLQHAQVVLPPPPLWPRCSPFAHEQGQAQLAEKNVQFHAHLEQLHLEAEHEIRSAVGELQGENELLRQEVQQHKLLQQERHDQQAEVSRLRSEVLALKTRLQSSEGDEMRQHVMAYEQVASTPPLPCIFVTHSFLAECAAGTRQAATVVRPFPALPPSPLTFICRLEAETARAQRAEDELRRMNRRAQHALFPLQLVTVAQGGGSRDHRLDRQRRCCSLQVCCHFSLTAHAGARTDHPAASLARLPSGISLFIFVHSLFSVL
jgi:hypothetical protein